MKKIFLLIPLLLPTPLAAVITEVYNLRISETTKRSAFEHDYEEPWLLNGTQANGFRKKYSGVTHGYFSGMGTLSYTKPTYYWRFDLAGGQVNSNDCGVRFARNQLDDFLISTGISHEVSNRIKLTASAILGVPLHPDTSLIHVQFGYGHFGIGPQVDGSFVFSEDRKHSVRLAARYIRFMNRKVYACTEDGPKPFSFTYGNLLDFFIALHYHTGKQRYELGFDETILCGTSIRPYYSTIDYETKYYRSDFYASCKHLFTLGGFDQAFTFAASCGFDTQPKIYGYRRLIVVWWIWEVNF